MATRSEKVWYFAYGSNMSKAKFTGDRGIIPVAAIRICLPNYVLVTEIPGVPYSEPSYASVRRRDTADAETAVLPDVIGVAYLLTAEQYRQVIASEGGQIAYRELAVLGTPIGEEDRIWSGHPSSSEIMVRTLANTTMVRRPGPSPSSRYMNLLTIGAEEANLPFFYKEFLKNIPRYQPPSSRWTMLGASIFLALVRPVWFCLDRITHSNTGVDGNVPDHIVWLVRSVIFIVWWVHDWVFAPIFGRGDGLDSEQGTDSIFEKQSLQESPINGNGGYTGIYGASSS